MLATQSILLILRQGLVHPGQCVPYLIALSTDSEQQVKIKAEQQLTEYTNRYGGIMQVRLELLIMNNFINNMYYIIVYLLDVYKSRIKEIF